MQSFGKNLFATAFLCLTALVMYAQPIQRCGSITNRPLTESEDHMQFVRDYYGQNPPPTNRAVVYLPLVLHLVGNDDGTSRYSVWEGLQRVCELNEQYAPSEIYFWLKEINLVNNTVANSGSDNDQENNLTSYRRANAVNVFVCSQAKSGSTVVCGYYAGDALWGAPGSPDFVIIGASCFGPNSSTLAHELGHYNSLRHSFSGWEVMGNNGNTGAAPNFAEKVNGSNCATAGDGLCDTGPDYLPDRWTCNSQGLSSSWNMNLNGVIFQLIDPTGDTFLVNGQNFMSYADDACQSYFTAAQTAKIRNYISSRRGTLAAQTRPAMQDTITAQPVAISPVNTDTTDFFNNVQLSWQPTPNATHYYVEVWLSTLGGSPLQQKAQFITTATDWTVTTLEAGRTYVWRVTAYNEYVPCGARNTWQRFRTPAVATDLNAVNTSSESLAVAPNPVNRGEMLMVEVPYEYTTEANCNIISVNGQLFNTWQQPLVEGINTLGIDTENLPAGMYILSLKTNEGQWYAKFVVRQ